MSLRLKYYWQGIDMHDVVSLVGKHNVLYVKNFVKNLLNPKKGKFYYVSRHSVRHGSMNPSATPIQYECSDKYFNDYLLDDRCIVISGDLNGFNAMIIGDNYDIPVLLGRESYAIRFDTPDDAIAAHAWFLSSEVSGAILDTLKQKNIASGKRGERITMQEIMEFPIPSIKWLRNNYEHGIAKAKCIGIGNHIVSSLEGASVNDPVYADMLDVLETARDKMIESMGVPKNMIG